MGTQQRQQQRSRGREFRRAQAARDRRRQSIATRKLGDHNQRQPTAAQMIAEHMEAES